MVTHGFVRPPFSNSWAEIFLTGVAPPEHVDLDPVDSDLKMYLLFHNYISNSLHYNKPGHRSGRVQVHPVLGAGGQWVGMAGGKRMGDQPGIYHLTTCFADEVVLEEVWGFV